MTINTTDPNVILMLFYIFGAIVLLAVAVVVYPTLRERAKREK